MLHHRSRAQAGLMPTGAALPVAQLPPFEFVSLGMAAARADEQRCHRALMKAASHCSLVP
jgi:hypothetical protein